MLITDLKQSRRGKKMSILRIAITCLLLLVISDKVSIFNSLCNCLNNFFNFNVYSLETLITNLMNIGRVFVFDYAICVGIECFVVEFIMCISTLIVCAVTIKVFVCYKSVGTDVVYNNHKIYIKSFNDTYLQVNKFIC